jgi:hypothetical protein
MEGTMQRGAVAHLVVLTLTAAVAGAAPQVLGPDDRPLERAAVISDAGAFWVSNDASRPVLLKPDADDQLRFPDLPVARLLVLDATTGNAVPEGRLRWTDVGIPDSISTITWSAAGGRLDLGCRGGESVELMARGYRTRALTLETGDRRKTIVLEPSGDLEIRVRPATAGSLWLADQREISVMSPFLTASTEHEIDASGVTVVRDLDAKSVYKGVIAVPGRAPVVGEIEGLPKRLELELGTGLSVSGTVRDHNDQPVARARVRATGLIDELGGFPYRQNTRTGAEGEFAITGLLAGEVTIRVCAPALSCVEKVIAVSAEGAVKSMVFHLEPGFDFRLVIQDEYGRPAAEATVIDTVAYRSHRTAADGSLTFKGVVPGDELALDVFGAGLRPWQGRVRTDQEEKVLRLPMGAVIEWPILTDRAPTSDEVLAGWSRLNGQGREIAAGLASWDPRHRLVRADGLDAGPHRLVVRLPGAATVRSEVVEVGPGDEIILGAVLPDRGTAISGRVLDGGSLQPVAGARVGCEPGSPHQFRKPLTLRRLPSAVTDADGVFLLEGLDPGPCRAIVRAPGYAAWRRDGVEPENAGADLGDIELDHGMTVVGRVVDRADRPQPGLAVEVTEDAAYAYFPETTLRTDHDGWFRVEALPVGRWALSARLGDQTALATIEGRAGVTSEVELRIGGLRLEGEVWIGDRRAAGGHLVLTTDGARGDGVVVMVQSTAAQRTFFGIDRPPLTIAVAGDGRFASDGVSAGVYTASYTPPGAGGSPVGQELVVPQTELHRCLIRFSDAGLEGVVVDPDGLPVAGAAIYVLAQDGRPLTNGFSDGEGAFVFMGLDEGTVGVVAVHSEFADAEPVEVELRSGQSAGPITLELEPSDGAELTLTVSSAGGSLSGAPVYLVGVTTLTGFTDDLGVASFTGIEAGRYRPCAAAYGGAAGCGPELEIGDGNRRDTVLELGGGGFVDVLLGPMERTPMLRVITADGIDLTSMLMMVSPPLPGPEGVRIGPLKTDQYRITVTMPEGQRQGSVASSEGETTVLDLR